MGDQKQKPELHPGNAVIAKLYSVVVDNENLPGLFQAWDEFVEEIFKKNPDEGKLWRTLLTEHFEQVGPLIKVSKPSLAEEKQIFIERQPFPAILFNSSFRIVAKNSQINDIWPAELDADISKSALPPFNAKRILSLKDHINQADPVLVSLDLGNEEQSQIVMAIIHPVEFMTGDGVLLETLFILRIAKPRWKNELGRMLASTYGLTETEIEVTRALYQNQNLNLIAKQRGRSIRTVRTQLSHIFEKTGASSQTELVSMISNLGQILDLGDKAQSKTRQSIRSPKRGPDIQIRKCKSKQGHDLSYAIYGAEDGKPIFSIQPTVPPEMTVRFRQSAYDAGLKFITPYKPGSGQTSSRNYSYTPEIAAHDFRAILKTEGLRKVDVMGLNSGGVFALQLAKTYPDSVHSVVLCDTGVPLKSMSDFFRMSKIAKRTFLPARFFPSILLTPHKMVAKEFHSSEAGQKKIVEYFFDGSPIDKALVNSDKEYYNITRDLIRYSFEDIRQLVENVCLWASDWEDLLLDVCGTHNIHFLHGKHNDVFSSEKVRRFHATHKTASAKIMSQQSQLGIFAEPETLMDILKR